MADRASPPPGVRRIGRWTLRRPLGKGGMGQTWLVFEDTPSGHPRMGVMKLLLASNVGDEATQRRWADEVRVLTMLRGCPNIVQIDDIGVDDGLLYLVMEYIRGANLAELMRLARRAREVFSPELVAWIGGEIIIGIAAFQSLVVAGVPQNLCHLDINPNNILVSQGGVIKIADFGIAKRESDDRTNRGTTAYMAPEHYVGLPSQKSDVFCWGLLMWELLELKPYRDRSDAAALRRDLASREVKHLSVKGVPPELARLIYDCLEHDEAKRPSSDQVVLRLEKLVTHPLARRREIIEFMGDYVLDVRTSGATEMFEALPADPTPDLEGLMAANKVLRDQGNEVTLSAVFGPTPPRPPAATRGPSRGPRRAIGLHDDDGPLPPPLFGAPASDDVVPELGRQVMSDPAAEPAAVLSNTRPLPAAEQARIVAAVAAPPPNVGQPAAPAAPTPRLDRTTPLPPLGVESGAVAPRNERAAVPTMMAVAMPNAVPRTPVAMPVFAAPPIAQPSDPRRAVEAIDRGEAPQPMDADAHTPVPRAGGMRPPTEPSPGEGTDRVPSAEHASVLGIPRGRFAGWLAGGCVLATAVGIGLGTWIIDVPAPMPKPIVHRDSPSVASGPTPTPSAGPRLEPRIEPAPTSAAPRHATTVAPAASASPAAPKVEPPDATIPASVAVAPAGPPPIPAADPVPVTASADTRPSVVSSKPKAKPAASLVAVELRVEWVGPGVEVKLAGKRYTVTDSVMLELAAGKHRIKWRRIGSDAWIDGGVFTLRPGVAHLMQFGNFGERGGVRHVERKR